jgi:uncharacterized repeat protein (TIGR01451 family)
LESDQAEFLEVLMKLRHVLPLLAVMCVPILSLAQLDPRERYGTFLGGSKNECIANTAGDARCANGQLLANAPATTRATAVTVDNSGNIYVAGFTDAIDFPTTTGAYRRTAAFNSSHGCCISYSDDTFVTKFSSSGQVVWSTYLGLTTNGTQTQFDLHGIRGIAVDGSGNVYVAGERSDNNADFAAVMIKLNSTGSTALFTFVGEGLSSTSLELVNGLALDSSNFVYLIGQNGEGNGAAVMKLDTTKPPASSIVFDVPASGYWPTSIALDSRHNMYITGTNFSSDFHSSSAFATELNATGNLVYSKVIAPSGQGVAIRAVSNGQAVMVGTSVVGGVPGTKDFGSTSGNLVFIARLSSLGSIVYSALVHDPNMTPTGLALDSAGEAFVTGLLTASSFRINPYSNAPFKGTFLLRLNSTGTALWLDSTFGGDAGSCCQSVPTVAAVAVDKAWNAYVVGSSLPGEYFPLTSNAYQSSFKSAASQGFLAKLIIEADVKAIAFASPSPVTHGTNLTYSLSVFNNGPDVSDGDTLTDVLPSGTTFVSFSTTNGVCTHPSVGVGGTFK